MQGTTLLLSINIIIYIFTYVLILLFIMAYVNYVCIIYV